MIDCLLNVFRIILSVVRLGGDNVFIDPIHQRQMLKGLSTLGSFHSAKRQGHRGK